MTGKSAPSTLIERYQRLIDISRDLASTLNLDALLDRIVKVAADLSDAEAASILLYDKNSQQLHFEVATNLVVPMLRGLVVPVESSLAGWIVTNRQPIIVSDAAGDPRHFSQVADATNIRTQSLLGIPLIAKDKVVGVLEVINKRHGQFDQDDQDLMFALGAQAAVAIENSLLFQQSDLISELVHELRTPLASVTTAANLLLKPEVSQEQREKMVEIIRNETFRLSEMTTSFLDLARLESGRAQFHPQVFDPKELLVECAGIMATRMNEKGLLFKTELPDTLPAIKADLNKIKQVVLNLLSNAIKYNVQKGCVILAAGVREGELSIKVSDTGPGISPDNIARLFQKFYRAPGSESMAPGTGLGLSICKRIIEAHLGEIEVTSELGAGTTFTVYLPLIEPG